MNLLELLAVIALGIVIQIAAFAALAFYRHWQSYQKLIDQVGDPIGVQPDAIDGRARQPLQAATAESLSGAAAWKGLRPFVVQHRVIEDASSSICSFTLAPVDGAPLPAFAPGQYLTFHLDVEDPATATPKPIVRCYSLSDAPDAGHYRVTIKRVEPPGLSSGHFHRHVHVGDVLAVKAPAGHFQLNLGEDNPIVLIGGGIGITPMLSMLLASLTTKPQREVWLFYGVRNGAEHIMKSQLRQLAEEHRNFHLHVCYSRPQANEVAMADYQHTGHVDIALLRQTLMLKPYSFYICGPRNMLETLVPALQDWGIADRDIHYEAFGPASLPKKHTEAAAAAGAAHPTVTFSKSNRSLAWSGKDSSLLEMAENNAIRVESGCRAGGCGTCQTKIASGEVEYSHDPDFDVEPGCCLLCIAIPKSDLTLVA